jgi:p-hydroxybenzoate 3-monooxygenase
VRRRAQVGIIGAGPAGLVLGHILRHHGVETVVIENQTREYIESRVRAGLIENRTVEILKRFGLAERLEREGMPHRGTELRHFGRRLRIPYGEGDDGRAMVVYAQQHLVADLVRLRLEAGDPLEFEVEDVRIDGVGSRRPVIAYTAGGQGVELECDVVAGCDGFHGVSRESIPAGVLTAYEREIPIAWLGILAQVGPSTHEIIYALHDEGFAGHMLRSSTISRFYLQVAPGEPLEEWPDERIWEQLRIRLATEGWTLAEGPILQKNVADMRSFVVEPMQYRSLFLAGDAAHIVPPTGAKGMNLAIGDAAALGAAIAEWCGSGRTEALDAYSATCLRRIWRAQEFSLWMTDLVHRPSGEGVEVRRRLQRARFEHLAFSKGAQRSFAERYAGLETDV